MLWIITWDSVLANYQLDLAIIDLYAQLSDSLIIGRSNVKGDAKCSFSP